MKYKWTIKTALAALILTLLSLLVDTITEEIKGVGFYSLLLISNLLICLNLGLLATHTIRNRVHSIIFLTLILWGVNRLNGAIETIIFNLTSTTEALVILATGLLYAIVAGTIVFMLLKPQPSESDPVHPKRSVGRWIYKLILADVAYLVVYLIAGGILMNAYPYLLEFYEGKIPAFGTLVKTQLLLRGPLYITIALLILYSTKGSRIRKSLLIGATLAIMGGISPLLIPNEFMPFNIRMAHLFETTSSNLLYGIIVGLILGEKESKEGFMS